MRAWLVYCAALSVFALGAWIALRLRAWRQRAAGRARQLQGKRGELRAERILEQHGYRILARQARASYELLAGDSSVRVEVVMDLWVERDGERLPAEVKTGSSATRLGNAETRRQLLEYQLATGAAAVLLVDADAATVTKVAFPLATAPARAATWGTALACVAAAAVALWWWTRA